VNSIVVCIASYNELSRRGEAALHRSLESLVRSLARLAARRPQVDAYVACCDDASTDATPDYIASFLGAKPWFKLVCNGVSRYASYSRNLAASLFPADVICFLDPDDEYCERHLDLCWDCLNNMRDDQGRCFAAVSTKARFSSPVHPEWENRISRSLPITKAIRREAWEFVEGMPTSDVYRTTGCEDQFLMQKLGRFFAIPFVEERSAVYWNYPGSNFDAQLAKFHRPPTEYLPWRDDPVHLRLHHQVRLEQEQGFRRYLDRNWIELGGSTELAGFAPAPAR
jgi:glycosyltransferase involved in cell wall biosynthesis